MALTWEQIRTFLSYYSVQLTVLLTPIIFLPLPLAIPGKEALAGYLLLLMGVYWCTEAIPLPVTALLPIVFAPLFGITPAKVVCHAYFEAITMMLMGGLIVAFAVEVTGLHRRIALKVLLAIGTSPKWLMMGFMAPTWLLSMWISNTAATAMMMPIVQEVLGKLEEIDKKVVRRQSQAQAQGQEQGQGESATKPKPQSKSIMKTIKAHSRLRRDSELSIIRRGSSSSLASDYGVPLNLGRAHSSSVSHVNAAFGEDTNEPSPTIVLTEMASIADSNTDAISMNNLDVTKPADEEAPPPTEDDEVEVARKKKFEKMTVSLIIAVAYAANVGGTATIIGTSSNLVFIGQADQLWQDHGFDESPVNFATYMVMGMPLSIINLLVVWIWLELFYIGPKVFCRCGQTEADKQYQAVTKSVIEAEYNKLGEISVAEIQVMVVFCILVVLWFMRDPDFIPGWSLFFLPGYTADAISAVAVGILLFVIPENYLIPTPGGDQPKKCKAIVTWKALNERMSWDVLVLLGGGFALAEVVMHSGLSEWIGDQLVGLKVLPDVALVMVLGFIVTLITQVTSNAASASLLLPIASALSEDLNHNPLYLMLTIAFSVQFAFMLPVANPSNAVAFSTGKIKVIDMVKAGTVLNIICVITMTIMLHTWAWAYFDLGKLPW